MSRELARADKEAAAIMQSLSKASEAAIETTLESINEKLKNNTPLMYHIHALLNNEDWTSVLEASALGIANSCCSDKPVSKDTKKLKKEVKKFEQLTRLALIRVHTYLYKKS